LTVYFDTAANEFVIAGDTCPDCDEDLYQSGCTAPGCNGLACENCGTGCDIDFLPDDESRCAAAIAAEPEDDRRTRLNAERAASGLPPIN
jgi:hypothetical protein